MTDQERQQKQRTERATANTEAPPSADVARGEQLKSDLDDLLDEIDSVLEENAEEFVRNYVQKGGE